MNDTVLYTVVPYAALVLALAGLGFRMSGFGPPVTARSSMVLESRVLFWGAFPWHVAIIAVLGAHGLAFLAPGAWGRLLGSPGRLQALEVLGLALGLWAVASAVILLVRRLAVARVRATTTVLDVLVLLLLIAQVALGVFVAFSLRWGSVWYLHTAVPWLRSLASLAPDSSFATVLPTPVRLHALLAFALVALLPFSRLVHIVTFPFKFPFRPRALQVWTAESGIALPRPVSVALRERALKPQVLQDWEPEVPTVWARRGKAIATRNLWISIPALFLSFAVWMVWSMVVVRLPDAGFRLGTDQLFWLAALPGLSGATLRVFYSFAVPILGGRLWTTLTTASLLVPAVGIGVAIQDPTTPYPVLLALALLAGLGGGNFASSMANISFFFPKALKGTALGLNAGLGNLGVSAMQLVVPMVVTAGVFGGLGGAPQTFVRGGVEHQVWLQNAGFVWVPFVLLSTAAAWLGMDDVASAKASFREQAVIFRRKHTWLVSWLYLGTFGSFIGFSAALPLLGKGAFPAVDPAKYAFLGPLLGALFRPVGGWLADRLGGARVTLATYLAMIALTFAVIAFLPHGGAPGAFGPFLASFVLLFLATGVGNGSTYRMIPVIFATQHARAADGTPAGRERAQRTATKEAAAVIGFASAFAAYGAFFVPKAFGTSMALTGGPVPALVGFVAYYATCLAVTNWFYARRGAEMPC